MEENKGKYVSDFRVGTGLPNTQKVLRQEEKVINYTTLNLISGHWKAPWGGWKAKRVREDICNAYNRNIFLIRLKFLKIINHKLL